VLLSLMIANVLAQEAGPTCLDVGAVPNRFQVAWVSEAGARVGSDRVLEVVRVADLRAFMSAESPDQEEFLQELGLVQRKGRGAEKKWQLTIFDVDAQMLCRPVSGADPGSNLAGVPACVEHLQTGGRNFTGCGYTLDTEHLDRGVDTFRVTWAEASAWGFCVFPLERFMVGEAARPQ
jgi:hypothetical protein